MRDPVEPVLPALVPALPLAQALVHPERARASAALHVQAALRRQPARRHVRRVPHPEDVAGVRNIPRPKKAP
jgi:hypothetical protein